MTRVYASVLELDPNMFALVRPTTGGAYVLHIRDYEFNDLDDAYKNGGRQGFHEYIQQLNTRFVESSDILNFRVKLWPKADGASDRSGLAEWTEWTPYSYYVVHDLIQSMQQHNIFCGGKRIYQVSLRGRNQPD